MKTDADEMGFDATPNAPAADNHLSLDNQALSDKKPVLRYRERDIHIQNVRVTRHWLVRCARFQMCVLPSMKA